MANRSCDLTNRATFFIQTKHCSLTTIHSQLSTSFPSKNPVQRSQQPRHIGKTLLLVRIEPVEMETPEMMVGRFILLRPTADNDSPVTGCFLIHHHIPYYHQNCSNKLIETPYHSILNSVSIREEKWVSPPPVWPPNCSFLCFLPPYTPLRGIAQSNQFISGHHENRFRHEGSYDPIAGKFPKSGKKSVVLAEVKAGQCQLFPRTP